MNGAAATNTVTRPTHSHSPQYSGISANVSIQVGGMEPWRMEAIQKVIRLGALPSNWDSHGSRAPSRAVRQTAYELLRSIPVELLPTPRVVPVSGGGYHFEWSIGDRELEISVDADCRVEKLRVEHGMPIEDEPPLDLATLFGWLASR